MIKINLLPWREMQRIKNKIALKRSAGLFLSITFFLMLLTYFFSSSSKLGVYKNSQKLLTAEINQIATEVTALQPNLKIKKDMQEQLLILDYLDDKRYQPVRFFNALSMLVPKGVLFNKVIRKSDEVIVMGESASNSLISDLMNNIQSQSSVANPVLTEAKTPDENITDVVRFQIRFDIINKRPVPGKEKDEKKQ